MQSKKLQAPFSNQQIGFILQIPVAICAGNAKRLHP